eukprot:g2767.t1
MARRRETTFEINEQFHLLDRDGNGKLSKEELMAAFQACGQMITKKELESMLTDVGISGPEYSSSDFASLMKSRKSALPETSQIIAAFECLDAQGDGFVSAQQLRKCLMNRGDAKFSKKEVEELMAFADPVDGQIDFKLFVDFMMAHTIEEIDPYK